MTNSQLDYETTDWLVLRQHIFAECAHDDYLANLELERKKGFEKGIEEARNDVCKNIVRTIRAKGVMTDEQIADMLNLPLDFVKNA